VIVNGRTASVSWAPSAPGGAAILRYTVVVAANPEASCAVWAWTEVTRCDISDIAVNSSTTLRVEAEDENGYRTASAPSAPFTIDVAAVAPTVPAALPDVVFDGLDAHITAVWDARPAFWGGGIPDSYRLNVVASPGGASCAVWSPTNPTAGCTVTGLTNGETYTFALQASSSAGLSPLGDSTLPTLLAVPLASCAAAFGVTTLEADATVTATVTSAGPETGFARYAVYIDGTLDSTTNPTTVASGDVLAGPLTYAGALARGVHTSLRVDVLELAADGASTGVVLCSAAMALGDPPPTTTTTTATPLPPTTAPAPAPGPAAPPVVVVPMFTG
jgi:hypothetical protein